MSVTQMTQDQQETGPVRCNRCKTALPQEATFCGHCGERVNKQGDATSSPINTTIEERYSRIEAIGRPGSGEEILQISRALDMERQVIIRDLDISGLEEAERSQAIEAAQNEYDQLRRQKPVDITPMIGLHYYEKHIYTIAGWPQGRKKDVEQHVTLEELLESGIGLPDEEIVLTWGYRICKALQQLHEQKILVGNLEPQTLAMNNDDYDGLPILMVAWVPIKIRELLKEQGTGVTAGRKNFSAPEVLHGEIEERSDLYSVGAILYRLLTGSEPEQSQIRAPRELVPEISSGIEQVVMQALAREPEKRFQSAEELGVILLGLCSSTKKVSPLQLPAELEEQILGWQQESQEGKAEEAEESNPHEDTEAVTVKVSPVQMQQAHWYLAQLAEKEAAENNKKSQEKGESRAEAKSVQLPEVPSTEESTLTEEQLQQATRIRVADVPTTPFPMVPQAEKTGLNALREQISGKLPAMPRKLQARLAAAAQVALQPGKPKSEQEKSWLKRLQDFILGEQQHNTSAAAILEAPLRIQPGQGYTLRIHLMGRDKTSGGSGKASAGLSGLVYGETIHVEVRSALYQNYAYVIQQADIEMPHAGYAAEVTIPMQPLSEAPNGRRERLHILFSDDMRRPLYERPFVIEIYTSHLVPAGQEGYNALTIPF